MNKFEKKSLIILGILDIGYLSWIAISSLMRGEIPFVETIVKSFQSGESFGLNLGILLPIVTTLVMISILASGIWMIQSNKKGVVVALAQIPFRLILFIPFSFFFIFSALNQLFLISDVVVYAVLAILEFGKGVFLILLLKKNDFKKS